MQPACLFLRCCSPAGCRLGLAAQARKLIGPLRGGPGVSGEPPLVLGEGVLGPRPPGDRGRQLPARGGEPLGEFLLLRPQAGRLGLELAGVAAGPLRLGCGQIAAPLGGEVQHSSRALGQPGQGEERLLRGSEPRCVLLLGELKLGLGPLCLGKRSLQRGPQLCRRGLVRLIARELSVQRRVIVREQAQPRIAQIRLDHGGLPGDLSLPAQRFQAPAQLAREVHQPGQIGLHRVELADGLFLAPPVLEHPGRFLDQGSAALGPGVQRLI